MTSDVASLKRVRGKPAQERGMTLSERAYEGIKADILSGALPAGSSLKLQLLSDRYDASFSPLREALSRLQTEQLVVAMPLRGFCIAPLSIEDLRDANAVRILVEKDAIMKACRLGDDNWEATIVAAFHSLNRAWTRAASTERQSSREDVAQIEARHFEFHMALISACGSARLLTYARQLHAETQRYRQPMLVNTHLGHGMRDVTAEHQAIMTAVLSRDGVKAADMLERHYELTASLVEKKVRESMG